MAKEKTDKEQPEGKSEEIQIPEKPKKKYSDMGMKSVLMIVIGSLLSVVLVIFALYWFLIRPDIIASKNPDSNKSNKIIVVEDEETLKYKEELAKIKYQAKSGTLKDLKFAQTQDIITNTTPPDWYVVIQLGVEYKEVLEKSGGGEHGKGESGLSAKLSGEISSVVTKFCGSKSIETIIGMRDSLEKIFYKELDPIFQQEKIFLHKVSMPKFVTQRA